MKHSILFPEQLVVQGSGTIFKRGNVLGNIANYTTDSSNLLISVKSSHIKGEFMVISDNHLNGKVAMEYLSEASLFEGDEDDEEVDLTY